MDRSYGVTSIDRIVDFLLSEDDQPLVNRIPDDAVLLIPDPENEGDPPEYGIAPGYYSAAQMLDLLERYQDLPDAIQFIADMLETGNPEDDEFAQELRQNKRSPAAIAYIVRIARQTFQGS